MECVESMPATIQEQTRMEQSCNAQLHDFDLIPQPGQPQFSLLTSVWLLLTSQHMWNGGDAVHLLPMLAEHFSDAPLLIPLLLWNGLTWDQVDGCEAMLGT